MASKMANSKNSLKKTGRGGLEKQTAPVSAEMARMAEFFKALSDATRLSALTAILDRELCVQEISELIGMSQSAVSHQLRLLRDAGLAKRRRQGRNIYYSLDDRHVERLIKAAFEHSTHTPGGRLRE